jgi:membrane protein implicated in regulation of membrane protease activity
MVLMTMASASLLVAGLGAVKITTLDHLPLSLAAAVLFFVGLSLTTLWTARRLRQAGRA